MTAACPSGNPCGLGDSQRKMERDGASERIGQETARSVGLVRVMSVATVCQVWGAWGRAKPLHRLPGSSVHNVGVRR